MNDQIKGATPLSSVINTVNTIIGSGILVLPYAFRTDSIFLGTLIILFAGLANGMGMILQGAASKFLPRGTATFFTVCRITYPKLSVLFDFAIFLQCFGVNISYLVLTGDLLPLVYTFDGWSAHSMKVFYIAYSTIMIVPLCLMKKIDSLKYASVVALAAIVYICVLIYGYFIVAICTDYKNIPTEKLGGISYFKPQGIKPVFKTLGVIVLAYTCPTQFSIVSELENPTMKRICSITYVSMSITAFIFLSVSYAGYLTFGNTLAGNILLMYGNNFYTQAGRALLVLMVILSFPLMFHPARVSFNNIYHVFSEKLSNKSETAEEEHARIDETSPLFGSHEPDSAFLELSHELVTLGHGVDVPMSTQRFYILSAVLLAASYSGALLLNSFELILSIVGATGGVLISFVLPGFYGYKLIASDDVNTKRRLESCSPEEADNGLFTSPLLKKISLFLIVWGLIVMFICLYSILFE
ncbi:hypothetical protein PICMEDRAFT_71575 [Pichia membranifaciens NRRL Y-2026]|uniref:Amino acid transporter transmembrane domain-containing protein n=1 Tax=Pichia membranifaciens NRRL Y-2026 TaxID=763406 RepID=A0A1E3NN35_9ASCO|nr:hypothetical protein PICMEDRAFT_71575 [Pichia membranifaciens NRRL Y-2026]ODQ47512.1 hypothetical protein PICMEDRAFT_71575 [Pichia membranifaciens NRRL Y-2026]